ncbi:MAG: PorP/SprF family type IX secretion system membrane protein [Saprospiraceae bacterium]|nr:PorP/SprF family type IX secretion system membrane protein [Saprospiraceae bacterium]
MIRIFPPIPILIGILASATLLPAQQIPFLNQYTWDARLFNPASQGADNQGEITAVYRTQFHDLDKSIRPSTYLLHADVSPFLGKKTGLGFQVMGDKTHILKRMQATGFFGYHLVENEKLRFSLGAMASFMNQQFDFDQIRVSDPLDLLYFNGQVDAKRFDGGPGMSLVYQAEGGSAMSLDVAVPQLFSNDVKIAGADASVKQPAVYGLVPHFLANVRFLYQGRDFAVEPNAAFRLLSGDRPLQTGIFDLNLNAYFLKNNLLMVGAGLRTGKGGFHVQLGVAPTPAFRLKFTAEQHSVLGASYEIGLQYVFEKAAAATVAVLPPADNTSDFIARMYEESKRLNMAINVELELIRSRQNQIQGAIERGTDATKRREKGAYASQCAELISQSNREIVQVEQTISELEQRYLQGEKLLQEKQAKAELLPPGAQNGLVATAELRNAALRQLEEIKTIQALLTERCMALQPGTSEMACLRAGDRDCVQDLFAEALAAMSDKPNNLFPLQVATDGPVASVTYRYPDDAEAYVLSPELRRLAEHIVSRMRQLDRQGAESFSLQLVTELQEDQNTLGFAPGLTYSGDLDADLAAYALIDNETGTRTDKQLAPAKDAALSLEELAALKLAALRQYLIGLGVPASLITGTIRYNHSDIIYREETNLILQIK